MIHSICDYKHCVKEAKVHLPMDLLIDITEILLCKPVPKPEVESSKTSSSKHSEKCYDKNACDANRDIPITSH